jgi:hypothetical protein
MIRIMKRGPFLLVLAGCATQHVRLAVPDTTPAQRYTCRPGKACEPASTDVPANPAGTLFFSLPRECRGRLSEIVVHDAGSSEPRVTVVCAPAEEPLGEMAGDPPAEPALEEMK